MTVWDVRSSKPVAVLRTSAHPNDSIRYAARSVKFSPNGDMLAFSEHYDHVHIYDTDSFTRHQRITVPKASRAKPPAEAEQPAAASESTAVARSPFSLPAASASDLREHGVSDLWGPVPRSSRLPPQPAQLESLTTEMRAVQERRRRFEAHLRSQLQVPLVDERDRATTSTSSGEGRVGEDDIESIADAFRLAHNLPRRSAAGGATASAIRPYTGAASSSSGAGGTSSVSQPGALSRLLGDPSWDGNEEQVVVSSHVEAEEEGEDESLNPWEPTRYSDDDLSGVPSAWRATTGITRRSRALYPGWPRGSTATTHDDVSSAFPLTCPSALLKTSSPASQSDRPSGRHLGPLLGD